jgi:hypothetical protein
MTAKPIKTQRPHKGDLVVGHQVYAFLPNNLPAVPAKVVAVSASGHAVIIEVDRVLAIFGLPRRTEWTWRKQVTAYQQKGERTSPGWGLALVRRS